MERHVAGYTLSAEARMDALRDLVEALALPFEIHAERGHQHLDLQAEGAHIAQAEGAAQRVECSFGGSARRVILRHARVVPERCG